MFSFDELPIWASICIGLAAIAMALSVVRLSGSAKYHKNTPDGVKAFIAFVLSQAVFAFFLPLVKTMNIWPRLLTGGGAEAAAYVGDAIGIVWSIASGITICMGLMPRNGLGTALGLLSYLIMNGMSVVFLLQMRQNGQWLSLTFYAGSIAIGLVAYLLALQRRRDGRRAKGKK